MAVYLVLLLCGLGMAVMVYRYDMYDREPLVLLALATAAGVGCYWLAGLVEDHFLASYSSPPIVVHAAITGVCEEVGKVLLVVLLAVICRPFFNDPIDGLIYGSFVGLGFGLGESFYTVMLTGPEWYQVPTEAVRLFLHTLMGGVGGYGIGLLVFPGKKASWPVWLASGVLLAMVTHFLWNFYVGLVPVEKSGPLTQVAAVLLMLGLTGIFGFLVVVGTNHSRRVFAPGDHHSLWGWPFRKPPGTTD